MTSTQKPSGQVRRAHIRRSQAQLHRELIPAQEAERLTEEIMAQAATKATAVALAQAQWADAEMRAWRTDLEARLVTMQQHPERNLGHIEEALAQASKEMLRVLAERAVQVKANTTPCQWLKCHQDLTHQKRLRRTINSRFGCLVLWRPYGWCTRCETWQFPADHALGLAGNAPASPYIQEISALLVSKMPRGAGRAFGRAPGPEALPLPAGSRGPPPGTQGAGPARRDDRRTGDLRGHSAAVGPA
jgi:hypothetical protein